MMNLFNEDFLIEASDPENYEKAMSSFVLPFLESRAENASVCTVDGKNLHCLKYHSDVPVGTVLIVHGFTENTTKYSELVFSLLKNNFCVVIYDQRGHGRSWRDENISDTSVTHIDDFSQYVSDMNSVYECVLKKMPAPFFVFAHSMGGAVASLFLEEHPYSFSSAVLSSPMIAPDLSGVPVAVALTICRSAALLGKKKNRPFFMKPYSGPEDFQSSCATDPVRFAWYDRIKAACREYQNSVPTYQWTYESIMVTKKILSPGAPERISCPVWLFSAEYDRNVKAYPQEQFIGRVKNGVLVHVKKAKHEIYRSVNSVLYPWWHQVLGLMKDEILPAAQ